MLLARIRNFFKVHNDSRLMRLHREFHGIGHQPLPSRRVPQEFHHFLDSPVNTVIVVQQRHHGKLDGGIERLHPLVQLILFQDGHGFRGRGFDAVLAVLVIHDGQSAVRADGVKLLGDEQVDLSIMPLQGSEAIGIPADEKRRAHRVVACRYSPNVRHAPATSLAHRRRFLLRFQRVISELRVREQTGGQVNADGDGDEKIHQQHGEQGSREFQDAAGAAPAHTLRVVKYRPTFLHGSA